MLVAQDDFPFHVKGLETTVKNYYDSAGGPKAYKGTSIPGFPNFYLILGLCFSINRTYGSESEKKVLIVERAIRLSFTQRRSR